jgi:hypothetical protein
MSSTNFELCNDISCNNYDATAMFYVNLSTFRNIFKFETTDISNNELPASSLTDTSANITYYVDSSILPEINPAHAMMDASGSEGITFTSTTRASNLLKHDFLYYIAKELLGSATSIGLYNNIAEMKASLEELGWSNKTNLETTFATANNSGNGMQNTGTPPNYQNLTKRILEQIKYHESTRLQTATSPQNDRIQNVTTQQSVPLIEGDSINYYWTLNHSSVTKRKYRIKLHLTDNTNNTNTQPTDSIANTTGYTNITSNGVPSF